MVFSCLVGGITWKVCFSFLPARAYRSLLSASRTHQLLGQLPWPLTYFSRSFVIKILFFWSFRQDISRSCGPIFIPSLMHVDIDSFLHPSTVGWSTLTFDLLFKVIYRPHTVIWSCRLDISRSSGPIFIPFCMLLDIDSLSNASTFVWSTLTLWPTFQGHLSSKYCFFCLAGWISREVFVQFCMQVDTESLLHASIIAGSPLTTDLLSKVVLDQNSVFMQKHKLGHNDQLAQMTGGDIIVSFETTRH